MEMCKYQSNAGAAAARQIRSPDRHWCRPASSFFAILFFFFLNLYLLKYFVLLFV